MQPSLVSQSVGDELAAVNPLTCFLELFKRHQDTECAIYGAERWCYGDLLKAIEEDRKRLQLCGILPGHVAIATGNHILRHLSLFFAVTLEGAVIAPVLGSREEVRRSEIIAQATHVIEIDSTGNWSLQATSREVTNPLLRRLFDRGEPGLIVFTSGSTGERKGILHSIPKLLRRFLTPRRTYRTLMFSTIDHLGGLNTALYMFSNAGFIAFPCSQKAEEACRLIQEHRIQVLPTTPSFLSLLMLSGVYRKYDLSSLELITYGSELMPPPTLQRLREVFPDVSLQQTYGLSELGLIRVKQRDANSTAVKIVGEGCETKVCDGTLWVRTPSAMEGYLNSPAGFTEDGWFDTGDLVDVDGEYITFRGRKASIINVAGLKVYPAEVESFLLAQPGVSEVVVTGEPNAFVGSVVVAYIVKSGLEPDEELIRRLKAECKKHLPRFMVPARVHMISNVEYSPQHKKLRSVPVAQIQGAATEAGAG